MSKVTKKAIFLLLVVVLAAKFFFYIDIPNSCIITIIPTYLPSNLSTKKIIKAIKYSSPEDYKLLCETVTTINKNVSCGGFDGGCYEYRKSSTLFLGNDQDQIGLAAAIVIHELCHRTQGREGREFSEKECYFKGSKFLEKVTVY